MIASAETIFADTNLFLRYLTDDVPEQADAFEQLLMDASRGEFTLVTSELVIAEIVWTLESYYHLDKLDIQDKVIAILSTPGLIVNQGDLVLQAIAFYVDKNIDFIDAYNAAWMNREGIRMVCTFDQKHFSRFDGFQVLFPGKDLPGFND